MPVSKFTKNPKSQVLERGYINVYSPLDVKERRQLFYNRAYKRINPSWDNTMILLCHKFELILKKLKSKEGGKRIIVLDAGCGHGNYVIDEFRRKIAFACGIDLAKRFTRKNICLDEIKYANLENIPYRGNSFEVALSLWVIEHLKNPEIVFRELYRVVKPGGFFLFSTPNRLCLLVLINNLVKKNKFLHHFFQKMFYNRKEVDIFPTFYKANDVKILSKMLRKAGFTDINLKLNYDPGYTSFNSWTFRISNFFDFTFEKFAPQWYKQHIVGLARKGE